MEVYPRNKLELLRMGNVTRIHINQLTQMLCLQI